MEKKGEVLNQLAIMSDLLEKVNIQSKTSKIIFDLSKEEFNKVFEKIQKKYDRKLEIPNNTFSITIGLIDIVFNTSNV